MIERKTLLRLIGTHLLRSMLALAVAGVIIGISAYRIRIIARSINEAKRSAAELTNRGAAIEQLGKNFAEIKDLDARIVAALPVSDNFQEYTSLLESQANKLSIQQTLSLSDPVPLPKEPGDHPLATIAYTVKLNATIFTFLPYLVYLENIPTLTRVTGLAMTSADPQGFLQTSSFVIQATTAAIYNL
jgi:cell division protein ZapA (FtsZ GTPase activity inhibitor)